MDRYFSRMRSGCLPDALALEGPAETLHGAAEILGTHKMLAIQSLLSSSCISAWFSHPLSVSVPHCPFSW